jgi:thiol-disulfide isomerase/thioredoxin
MVKPLFRAVAAVAWSIGVAAAPLSEADDLFIVAPAAPMAAPAADPFAAPVPMAVEPVAPPAESVAPVANKPRLEMVNGDFYTGTLLDSDRADALSWQCDYATEPFVFALDLVSAAHFPREGETPRANGEFCFELSGGDVMFGSLVGLSDEAIEVETIHFGKLRIQRSQVRRIQRWGDFSGIEYLGPEGLRGWTPSVANNAWREEAGHIVADQPATATLGDVPLPSKTSIEVELSWKTKADFSLQFGTSGADLRAFGDVINNALGNRQRAQGQPANHPPAFELSVWSGSLVLVREGEQDADLAPVQKLPTGAGRVSLQLFFDQTTGEVAAYSIEGKQLARVKVANESGPLNFGVRLTNKRGDVRLERLVVRRWSGAPPTEVPADQPYVQLSDGKLLLAADVSFDTAARELIVPTGDDESANDDGETGKGNDQRVPIDQLACLVFPAAASWKAPPARAALHDGVRISGTLDRVADGKLRLVRAGVEEPFNLPVAELQSLVSLTPSAPPPPQQGAEGRLLSAGVKSRGKLVDAKATDEASCLAWQPYGSETSSPLRTDFSGRIVYREPPAPVQAQVRDPRALQRAAPQRRVAVWGLGNLIPRAPVEVQIGDQGSGEQLLWLRAGDRIPGKLISIDERGVTFETPLVEATFLPHDSIKAWDLSAGSQPRALDEIKRNRLLTLPRMQRPNPPTHLIESTKGDFLRGRVVSMDEDTLTVEVRLEQKRIPRKSVARIIWFEKPPTAKDDEDAAAARRPPEDASETPRGAALRVQVVRSDGVRLTFEPKEFAADVLRGTSELLGACQAPVANVDQLLLGGAIAEAASELAYAQWRLLAAADPRFVSEGDDPAAGAGMSGTESALVGKAAPEIRLDMLEGGPFQLSEHRGKVVIIDFWATWCGWCMQSMPEIATMVEEFDGRAELFPINQQEDKKTIAAALERLKLPPHTALDVDGAASEHFGVTAIPQTVIVGPDGKVTNVFVGGGPGIVDKLRQAIRTALGDVDTGSTDDAGEVENSSAEASTNDGDPAGG